MPRPDPSFTLLELAVATEGLAMSRAWPVRADDVRARLDEIRSLLARADDPELGRAVAVHVHDVQAGYERWAPRYDGPNPAIDLEERAVHRILRALPVGDALDAGCGTGRQAAFLHGLGHTVTGLDATEAMLAVARTKLPSCRFERGSFTALPFADSSFDLVVCSLALTHTDDLRPVLAEFARVVRPGGNVVVSDIHAVAAEFGAGAVFPGDEGALSFVPNVVHPVGSYVRAARACGLSVEDCEELALHDDEVAISAVFHLVPDAVRQGIAGLPFILVWRFAKPV